jgi:hypothetical protein
MRLNTRHSFIAALVLFICAYLALVRPWHRRWGALDDEVTRPLPGDELIPRPSYATTRAVTIQAPPEAIWPWLVQIGNGRGGLYSYDGLDRLFGILDAPSADRILPQHQDLTVGDVIPLGAGPSWPVQALDAPRFLQVGQQQGGAGFSWVWYLDPIDSDATRLISRVRGRLPRSPLSFLILLALDPAGFLMERKMLLGIKERAERAGG